MEVVFAPQPPAFLSPPSRDLRGACREFEALLLQRLLEAMDRTVFRSGLFGSGGAQRLYRSLWYQALAEEVARGGGLGVAELLLERLGAKVLERSADKIEDREGVHPAPGKGGRVHED